MKNKVLLLFLVFTLFALAGCGKDPQLAKFQNDINDFCADVAAIDAGINSIDARSDTAKDELLDYLDQLDQSFKVLAGLSVPEDFSYIEELADDASSYMTTAVESYHEAFGGESYDEPTAEYARLNYERAYKRVTIILKLLRGEDISEEGVSTQTDSPVN